MHTQHVAENLPDVIVRQLADGVQRRGVAEGPQVFGADRGGEGVGRGRPAIEHVVEEELGVGPDEPLGQPVRRGQEGPDPEAEDT